MATGCVVDGVGCVVAGSGPLDVAFDGAEPDASCVAVVAPVAACLLPLVGPAIAPTTVNSTTTAAVMNHQRL